MAEVEKHQPGDGVLPLLGFTNRYNEEALRQAALSKLRNFPNLEEELMTLLQQPYAFPKVYMYLEACPVSNTNAFLEPLKGSIQLMHEEILRQIKVSNNLQSWSFDYLGLERLLHAIDSQFPHLVGELAPGLRQVHTTLKGPLPPPWEKVQFEVTPVLGRWLKKHKA